MPYKHTQIGYLMIVVLIAIVLYFAGILMMAEPEPALIPVLSIVVLILASFLTLTVWIDGSELKIKFGYGLFNKRFALSEIVSAKAVKNRWYNGWGIRFWWKPRMMIFNVSGFDAVEIKMKNGKIYRIGTDEPGKLEAAIRGAIRG
jgi:hypothetical protein